MARTKKFVYSLEWGTLNLSFVGEDGVDQNDDITIADFLKIVRSEFPGVKLSRLSLYAHSGAGINVSRKRKSSN
ncbi:MAG: hypothetical protein A3B99_03125 [Candidatus Yanofskybacteria bacterium RIFCSPHIGHO2_02_FULL_44_12b]|uniref:Uncharacterized protein n=1 Tax=Candidatus Yanofskybacteria bacterium GW2011_GWA2_44_9 TaxID=1619025 RepID=A0A0G1MNW1_9BACT|nr:MAG: hypothetical protein UW79_C0005G0017 [Candidatus Yanofskybacteria bacterium GW2011_GWA2_44_9]OGN05513.1 MAG: hypothetical protein A2659_02900 [Candidatus Yanofskybacteria bacterium RIFCSPHIGHO2_01_FULL_44_24]OGN15064.1 MAG: hypothetical protein A3B99_03125 [Candidatus Yanofskybacteria bacterium RIFCSPHIGHO2_02_FULL_44_12b]